MAGAPTEQQNAWMTKVMHIPVAAGAMAHAGAHHKGGKNQKDKIGDLEAEMLDAEKTSIVLVAASALQEAYNDLGVAIENWSIEKKRDIKKLKKKQTPRGGGSLFLEIVKTVNTVAHVAFPELKALEAVAAGLDVAAVVQKNGIEDPQKEGDVESDNEMQDAKDQCIEGLEKVVADTHKKVLEANKALIDTLDKALMKATREDLQLLKSKGGNQSQYGAIRKLIGDNYGIKRGDDAQPGAIGAITTGMTQRYNKWVMDDFKTRRIGKAVGAAKSSEWNGPELIALKKQLLKVMIAGGPNVEQQVDAMIKDGIKHIKQLVDRNQSVASVPKEADLRAALEQLMRGLKDEYLDVFYG